MNKTERHSAPTLDLPRARVEAAFAAHGFTFAPVAPPGDRPRRPRAIGTTGDGRASLELIGPEHTVFKATLLVSRPAGDSADALLRADLTTFVRTLLPDWVEGEGWVTSHVAALGAQGPATTRVGDWQIDLRTAVRGTRVALGATWWPE